MKFSHPKTPSFRLLPLLPISFTPGRADQKLHQAVQGGKQELQKNTSAYKDTCLLMSSVFFLNQANTQSINKVFFSRSLFEILNMPWDVQNSEKTIEIRDITPRLRHAFQGGQS